ncbi:MAG: competence protein ComEC family protein [Bacteroidales bacterium]|nr:competence protein ComEC family protein [Bacteroidales bacterium]
MKFWHQYPFIRLIIPIIAGIVSAISVDKPLHIPVAVTIGILVLYFLLVFVFSKLSSYKYRWLSGILINIILIIIGYEITILNTPKFNKNNISALTEKSQEFIVRVTEPVSEKPNSYKIVVEALYYKDSLEWNITSGKAILYLEKDSLAREIGYGDKMIIQTKLNEIKPPQNPGEFNYKRYLANKGTYNQSYIKSKNWLIIDNNGGNPIKALGISIRTKFLKILESQNIKGKEFAVASAILLGYDDKLDSEQQKEFAGAGAMHILCVSGLHVGIIYVILNNLLLFMDKKRWARFLKVFMLLLLIWIYALITGFSPSVLRASTMFSFIILGRSMKRKPNIYNSLAASAFLLLAINPYIITQVGFQLSYIAVIGIVMIYKPVYNVFIPGNWLLRKIWQITVVSIAATISTFPLSIYYFHQFPNLFLVTNLIAIPASMLIIYTGLIVLLTSPVPVISGLFAKALTGIIWFLNFSVKWIEGLPFSTIQGIYINFFEMVLIFGLLISLIILLLQRRKLIIYYSIVCFAILMLSFTFGKFQNLNRQSIVVYNINKSSSLDFIDGKQCYLLADSLLLKDKNKQAYHIQNNRWQSGVDQDKIFDIRNDQIADGHLLKRNNFIQFFDKRLLIIDPLFKFYPFNKKIKVDYIVISQNPKIKISDLKGCIDFSQVIFDSSNSGWRIKKWSKECQESGTNFYDVKQMGACIIEL